MVRERSRASTPLNLRINGEDRDVVDNVSLSELVTQLDLTPERIAIELNQNVVRRVDWPSTVLKDNDRVEIVHFVGGGGRAGGRRQEQVAGGSRQEAVGRRNIGFSVSALFGSDAALGSVIDPYFQPPQTASVPGFLFARVRV